MSAELEKMFSPEVLAAFDERARQIARDEIAARSPQDKPTDEELTVRQVAKLKGVEPRTVYDWVARKRIPFHYTPGNQLRFYRRHVETVISPN